MNFWKMNGAGNDFIILNNLEKTIPTNEYGIIAQTICERHLSIGADGLMIVEPSSIADIKMCFYNSDGSEGEMCGNGARCICRYAYENGFAKSTQSIETVAGIVYGWRIDQSVYRIRLNDPSVLVLNDILELPDISLPYSYVELGKPGIPHVIVKFSENIFATPEAQLTIARQIRNSSKFPKGANVNFYTVIDRNSIILKTYERGVEDFTYACGTGTGATVLALFLQGYTNNNVSAQMRGGILQVEIDYNQDSVQNIWLKGPTNIVAIGEITDSNLPIKEKDK